VLFPFFFRYELHHESWEVTANHAAQLDTALWWKTGAVSIRLSGRAMFPFSTHRTHSSGGGGNPPPPGEPPAPRSTSDSTHGGLLGTLELVFGR